MYEPGSRVSAGVVAVVELALRATGADAMAVANAISTLGHLMEALQLSVSNPAAAAAPQAPRLAGAAAQQPAAAEQASEPQAEQGRTSPPRRTMSQGLARTTSHRRLLEQ